ncbi:MAG: hypothetical protein HY659_05925 [Rhizobiales bacterium]|nr:hypothetical protein [Hyphomicrobiales bacterium]
MSANRTIVAGALAAIIFVAGLTVANGKANARPYWGTFAIESVTGKLVRSGAVRATTPDFAYVAEPGFQRCSFVARYDAQGNVAGVVKACTVTAY